MTLLSKKRISNHVKIKEDEQRWKSLCNKNRKIVQKIPIINPPPCTDN